MSAAHQGTPICRAAQMPNGWQLVGEYLVTVKTKRGFSQLEWQQLRERNEALDCRVYARAAAWIAGADRWTEAMWRNLEQQIGASEMLRHKQAKEPDARRASLAFSDEGLSNEPVACSGRAT